LGPCKHSDFISERTVGISHILWVPSKLGLALPCVTIPTTSRILDLFFFFFPPSSHLETNCPSGSALERRSTMVSTNPVSVCWSSRRRSSFSKVGDSCFWSFVYQRVSRRWYKLLSSFFSLFSLSCCKGSASLRHSLLVLHFSSSSNCEFRH